MENCSIKEMFVLEFKKDGEMLYTILPKPCSSVHQCLIVAFKDYNNLLFNRQYLSFFNPVFVQDIRDHCTFTQGFYNNPNATVFPNRVDVRYLR